VNNYLCAARLTPTSAAAYTAGWPLARRGLAQRSGSSVL